MSLFKCCLFFVSTLMLTTLLVLVWLNLITYNPYCSIQYFYLPALNKTLDSPQNATLFFMVRLDNPNKDKGIHYDNVKLTFSESVNRSGFIGNYTIPSFYQGHKKEAKKSGHTEINKQVVSRAVFPNGTGFFRVDLETTVRFKILSWNTKRHKIVVGANIKVNGQGTKVKRKGVELKSVAPQKQRQFAVLGFLVNVLVFVLL